MPTYDYFCETCSLEFDVIKSIKEHKTPDFEKCTACGKSCPQVFSCNIHFVGEKIKDAYKCPALGEVIKSDKHRNEVAKRRGVIEIGNEKPDKIHKYFDNQREDKRKKAYDE